MSDLGLAVDEGGVGREVVADEEVEVPSWKSPMGKTACCGGEADRRGPFSCTPVAGSHLHALESLSVSLDDPVRRVSVERRPVDVPASSDAAKEYRSFGDFRLLQGAQTLRHHVVETRCLRRSPREVGAENRPILRHSLRQFLLRQGIRTEPRAEASLRDLESSLDLSDGETLVNAETDGLLLEIRFGCDHI